MYMQTAAMRFHTPLEYTFMDGTFPAEGDPDALIMQFYPNRQYFEWFQKGRGLDKAVAEVVRFLKRNGPFDGMMGFSQGASLVTTLAHLQQTQHELFQDVQGVQGGRLFDFVVLIGGVTPSSITAEVCFSVYCLRVY
jgi:hypothetical protein